MLTQPQPSYAPNTSPYRRPRVLYFDIDGTLVRRTFDRAKTALADGRFERLVRDAGFDRLVCVSDAILIGNLVADELCMPADARRTVLRLCRGTIRDEVWFHERVELIDDPTARCRFIDTSEDWYYVDDCAYAYAAMAGLDDAASDRRILECDPEGEGGDVAAWLAAFPRSERPRRRRQRAAVVDARRGYSSVLRSRTTPYSFNRL